MSTISAAPHRAQFVDVPNIEPVIGDEMPRILALAFPSLACTRCQCSDLGDTSLIAIVSHSDDDEMVEAAARELSLRLSVPGRTTNGDLVAGPVEAAAVAL